MRRPPPTPTITPDTISEWQRHRIGGFLRNPWMVHKAVRRRVGGYRGRLPEKARRSQKTGRRSGSGPNSPRSRCHERWRVTCGSNRFGLTAVHGWVVFAVLCWCGSIYRGLLASLEAEADLRWFLCVRRSGVTTPLSTTKLISTASPRVMWPVENAHMMAAPTAVPTTAVMRSMVQTRRRAAGRSARSRDVTVCNSPDFKRAQQQSTAGTISARTRIHSTVATVPGYNTADVCVERNRWGVERTIGGVGRKASRAACPTCRRSAGHYYRPDQSSYRRGHGIRNVGCRTKSRRAPGPAGWVLA
jgi:hypothetical protein